MEAGARLLAGVEGVAGGWLEETFVAISSVQRWVVMAISGFSGNPVGGRETGLSSGCSPSGEGWGLMVVLKVVLPLEGGDV